MTGAVSRVAVVGTGRMGAAMAVRLSERGHDVVALFNRTRAKADAVAETTGSTVVDTPREAAERADVVVVSLGDDDAVTHTYDGTDGLVAGLRSAAVIVETSTIDPQTVRDMRPAVEATGAALLDAPVSGSVALVEKGELTFMVGGDAEPLGRAQPVLEALAKRVLHVGASGAGAAMKLAVNAVVMGVNQVLSEALVLAEASGVQRSDAYEVFASSAIASPFVQYKRAAFERPEETPVAFSLDLVLKDLTLITTLAQRLGVAMDQTATNRIVAQGAVDAGLGERDMSAIAGFLRKE
ncbi:NAD(P)-dependent oxidoreductase [Phytoactinopolyspora halotolerans]|uniref:NAD(P)-dependent oxidoreductase n=1 Tax=Phytoactinopolyspora halotolerans TaxID=1981512 RepID=A0A6L9SB47_9ACTN|nr:NAD(P)-dependent oxidoreductase [Phytoactinopolyspora halotolerans]NEE02387.1 NAD(P)-dependent oxidoreductase [Phytoactinopolyspora halotolerans]